MMPAQAAQYLPWLEIAGVFVLLMLIRLTRKALRRRVDEIGYRLQRERGLLIWFWLNAPGVMLHELSHALVVLFFYPFGFRITSITLFRVRPRMQTRYAGRNMKIGGRQSLQLGEVQYIRPQGKLVSYIGDGFSGIAPLFGGIAMFILLYWVATGYNLWDYVNNQLSITNILRPGWPWWTLLFAPYLILTITSELWPSRKDWEGAFWFVIGMVLLIGAIITALWYFHQLNAMFSIATLVAQHVDFALLILLALDLIFLAIAELLAHTFWR